MAKPSFPAHVPPMVAESAKAAFDSPDWIFEIKLDGYRAITVFDSAGEAHLWSRNGLPLEAKFPALANAVSKLKLRSTILDGEVVALDENGIPRFQLLQRFQKQPKAPTLYYVFDVLWYKGEDLTGKSILERRSVLERILKPTAGIQLGNYVEDEGKALFELTKERGMEGIIAKRKDSIYRPGKRSSDWLKIKTRLQQEFVVGGFTAPKGSRKHLGAIVLGAYTKGKLRHYGYAGSGFTEKGLKDAIERMKPFFVDKCPFTNPPNIKEKIQWVRPDLVCEVEYAELTADDQLRQTTFLGWRDDKKAREVVLEQ
ncbi:MAG: non-homologous end-joining DNA ligase [Verrucomicrobia bacterium]|nr:non-homologous end-joining DNA ligase [Verrucomicrobiota bacterium]